jgi:magnesium-transporting ATPase (P-type)|tara:strand:- start:5 stop:145 length:141 start_codon:yes stop_codon:yes gene_type:complete
MVSGDHKNTAMAVAYQAGILDSEDSNLDLSSAVMEGADFRTNIGGY